MAERRGSGNGRGDAMMRTGPAEPTPETGASRRGGCARWAAILLPFVLAARVALMVKQERELHRPHLPPPPPAWPAHEGETLRFGRAQQAVLARWQPPPEGQPLMAALVEKDYLPAEPDSGCALDPAAMAGHGGGTLTLGRRDAAGRWPATWDGHGTMRHLNELPPRATAGMDADQRRAEAALLMAADCGGHARLNIGDETVHALVNLLTGRPLPPPVPGGPPRRLVIHVPAPPPR